MHKQPQGEMTAEERQSWESFRELMEAAAWMVGGPIVVFLLASATLMTIARLLA